MDHPRPLFRSVYSITKNTILPQIQNKTLSDQKSTDINLSDLNLNIEIDKILL